MAEQEEDFSQLPLEERFQHKQWKVRKEGYEAAVQAFEVTPDESDPVFRPFIQDPGLWKGAAADSNVAAQQEGLAALRAFLKYAGPAASRSQSMSIPAIYEKALISTRPAAKASGLEALLLYVEIGKPDVVIEDLLPALSHKLPKVVAAALSAFTQIYHNFGVKVVEPKPVLKALPKAFAHADKNVRAEASNLTVELYRWLKEAMKPIFWNELKPVQQTDLETLFEKARGEPAPKQERLTRTQQAQQASARAVVSNDVGGAGAMVEAEEEEDPVEVDAFDLAEPVDVFAKIPGNFQENIASTKWKERKDALDALFEILNTPRIKEGPFDDIVRALAKCMKDANIAVVTVAGNCVEKLAVGLRKGFARYRSVVLGPVMDRLKEKKQSVADALGAALDAIFTATSFSDCVDETLTHLVDKNPNVKGETIKFLVRCLRNTRDVPSKDEQKRVAEAGTKLLTESTEAMRAGGAEILGTLMKIIGERAMGPHMDGLDDLRKTKIKECFDAAEVKAKEKPKPVAAPSKPGPGPGKKVAGGAKKPPPKKPTQVAAAPTDEAAPLQPRPTAKVLPKAGGLQKPGLAAPSALKLGGLKKPAGIHGPAAISSPQRRVISPPVDDGEEEVMAPSPSKIGRGGLAGRPLSKPSAAPPSPPRAPAISNALSTAEKAELEELRVEKERLSALNESLRSSTAKLTAEISELQNQNAQLIEDHTRDVLQIKAKETQLVRARGECDVLKGEIETVRKESERYKRELSRLGRESLGRERDEMLRGRHDVHDSTGNNTTAAGSSNNNNIYEDYSRPPYSPRVNGHFERPGSAALNRTGSAASNGSRPTSARPQSHVSSFSPSEEKENNDQDAFAARRKISPPANQTYASIPTGGRSSPARPSSGMGRDTSGNANGAGEGENWKRAAEVTSQLKARIEAMKARQGMNKPGY